MLYCFSMDLKEKNSALSVRLKQQNMTIGARNRVIQNIYHLIATRRSFLILGHKSPDEDCYASTVAGALLLRKFNKHVSIFFRFFPLIDYYKILSIGTSLVAQW